jgi:hypothetical protein
VFRALLDTALLLGERPRRSSPATGWRSAIRELTAEPIAMPPGPDRASALALLAA